MAIIYNPILPFTKKETYEVSEIIGLQTLLNAKANAVHTHAIADVTGLQTALDLKTSNVSLGNVLFVSSSAPIANDGQSRADALGRLDKPFRTIQAAVNVASPSGQIDTIIILAGTYTENISYSNKTIFFDFQRCVLNGNISFLENNFAGHYINIVGKQAIVNGQIIVSGDSGANIIGYIELFQINTGVGLYPIFDNWLKRTNVVVKNTIINCQNLIDNLSEIGRSYFENCTINCTNSISNFKLNNCNFVDCRITTAILGSVNQESNSSVFTNCDIILTSTSDPLRVSVNYGVLPIKFYECKFFGSCADVFIVNNITGRGIALYLVNCDFENYTFGNGIVFYNNLSYTSRLVITNTILKTGTNTYKAGSVPATVEVLNNLIYI